MDFPGIAVVIVTLIAAAYAVLKRNPLLFVAALVLPFISFKTPLGFITIPAFLAWGLNSLLFRLTKMNFTSFFISLLGIIFPLTQMLTGMINDGFFGISAQTSGKSLGGSIGAAIAFGILSAFMVVASVIVYLITSLGISVMRWHEKRKQR